MLGGGLLQAARPVLVQEHELVKDALNVLIGVVSTTFPLCQVRALPCGLRANKGSAVTRGTTRAGAVPGAASPAQGARALATARCSALFSQL